MLSQYLSLLALVPLFLNTLAFPTSSSPLDPESPDLTTRDDFLMERDDVHRELPAGDCDNPTAAAARKKQLATLQNWKVDYLAIALEEKYA
ncbi:uncharacterized protein KY384_000171 [Bacidia gigantensis]|uniref:uncharacterized protein n=1 Tax=Bacidia gigantensis TaxID=2732470 RepID=UPI001D051A31|nr:uncharacterized protein KY384_000171 [Bacidia gigantensis]KAG8526178.1 hypothetical protein KY384_000171 [Bacidia gigantensis]